MGKDFDECVKEVSKKIKKGEIPKFFEKEGKKVKSNPFAICSASLKQ